MNINFAELENLRKRVLAHPAEYYQPFWGFGPDSEVVKDQKPVCKTAGCLAFNVLAGHGYSLYFPFAEEGCRFQTSMAVKGSESVDIASKAQEILGLDDSQASELFSGGRAGWSPRAQLLYRDSLRQKNFRRAGKMRAQAAALAIEDFVAKYRAIEAFGKRLHQDIDQYAIKER